MSNLLAGTGISLDWDDVTKELTINNTGGGSVDSVNGQTGVVVLDADDIADTATNVFASPAELTKLAGIEAGADVTDATNVDAAGATMNTDTDVSGNAWVLNEPGMSSYSATKVPTQASVKDYVDAQFAGAGYTDEMARDAIGTALVGGAGITVTPDDPGNQITIASTITQYTDEMARDAIGTALVGSSGVSATVDDSGDTITLALTTAARTFTVNFIIDGGGSVITTGTKGVIVIDRACTIQSVTLLADVTGSIVIDIWKDTYANHPPTVADTITASAKPTISSGVKQQDTTLTGWTTSIAAGDILRFNVDSVTTIQRCTVSLKMLATA